MELRPLLITIASTITAITTIFGAVALAGPVVQRNIGGPLPFVSSKQLAQLTDTLRDIQRTQGAIQKHQIESDIRADFVILDYLSNELERARKDSAENPNSFAAKKYVRDLITEKINPVRERLKLPQIQP